MKKYLYAILVCLSITSCHVLPKKEKLYTSYTTLDLGVVGIQKKSLRKSEYQVVGVPEFKKRIRLNATIKKFTASNFKSYTAYIDHTSKEQQIQFNDSIQPVPNFIEFEITDKVQVIEALNSDNIEVQRYLVKNPDVTIVSKLKGVTNPAILEQVKKSDTFYLQTSPNRQQFIHMYKGDKLIGKINTSAMDTFEYDVSSFCWQVSDRDSMKIIGMVEEGELCRNDSYRNPNKAIKDKIKKYDF
ncbi:hypothetical protein [Tenacibaculum agarivorans]|uniref:hypothetical protein n=1 Tax=Tenacibaculum agarivorans TaxID=1908389 RepID=UPI00094BA9E5|nr:hypothetical protein [Tenacibaculum agarivorans]